MAKKDSDETAAATRTRTPIVGIGASAGGIHALMSFFDAIPAEIGATFVVIVHLAPDMRSELHHVLQARSKLSVTQVQGKSELKPNCIYVIPPGQAPGADAPPRMPPPSDPPATEPPPTEGGGAGATTSGAGSPTGGASAP